MKRLIVNLSGLVTGCERSSRLQAPTGKTLDCPATYVSAFAWRPFSVARQSVLSFTMSHFRLYALSACLAITACTHTPVAVCPPLRDYNPAFSQRLASELDPLPPDSAIVQAIGDYIQLRDAVRACRS